MPALPDHAAATAVRLNSPSCLRNQGPILAQLQRLLPPAGHALEIACGSGQHALHFASALPGWHWQPTDADAAARASTDAWAAHGGLAKLAPALALDLLQPWPDAAALAGPFDLVFSANLLHISPWASCAALMHGGAARLRRSGLLITYGPYVVDGEPLADSNAAFDADLRQRNPAWGLRRLRDVQHQASLAGLALRERVAMPANNLLLVWAPA